MPRGSGTRRLRRETHGGPRQLGSRRECSATAPRRLAQDMSNGLHPVICNLGAGAMCPAIQLRNQSVTPAVKVARDNGALITMASNEINDKLVKGRLGDQTAHLIYRQASQDCHPLLEALDKGHITLHGSPREALHLAQDAISLGNHRQCLTSRYRPIHIKKKSNHLACRKKQAPCFGQGAW